MEFGFHKCVTTSGEKEMESQRDLLSVLAEKLHVDKLAEKYAQESRIATEARISALIPTDGTEQKTVTLENGYKVTVKRPISYKADVDGIREELKGTDLPVPLKCDVTTLLDVKGYEWYRDHLPVDFVKLSKYVTIKPLKVSVGLKLPKGE